MGLNHWKSIGMGVAAGAVTAAGILAGRKTLATAKISQGHPLKHRMLDIPSNTGCWTSARIYSNPNWGVTRMLDRLLVIRQDQYHGNITTSEVQCAVQG